MEFSIQEYKGYHEEEILSLYKSVGWTNYTDHPEMLKNAYANSLKILGAYQNKNDQNENDENKKLLGIIRVVGDGHSVVFIQDLLVYPEYQRQGIGTALQKQILQDYKYVYQKHLLTEHTEKNIQFYKSLGFLMDTDIECRAFSIFF